MVNLFGDWWGDATVMFLVFLVFVIMWLFYFKEKKSRNQVGLVVALIIFVISTFEVLGTFWGDTSYGPPAGLLLSIGIMIISLICVIIASVEVTSDRK